MRGATIQTEARTILDQGIKQGISENQRVTAIKMLKSARFSVEEISEYTSLSIEKVEQLSQTLVS